MPNDTPKTMISPHAVTIAAALLAAHTQSVRIGNVTPGSITLVADLTAQMLAALGELS